MKLPLFNLFKKYFFYKLKVFLFSTISIINLLKWSWGKPCIENDKTNQWTCLDTWPFPKRWLPSNYRIYDNCIFLSREEHFIKYCTKTKRHHHQLLGKISCYEFISFSSFIYPVLYLNFNIIQDDATYKPYACTYTNICWNGDIGTNLFQKETDKIHMEIVREGKVKICS